MNLKLRRKERSSVSVIVVANVFIRTNYFDVIGESLNLTENFHLLKWFWNPNVSSVSKMYFSCIKKSFRFPPSITKRVHGIIVQAASFILCFGAKVLNKIPQSWKHKTVNQLENSSFNCWIQQDRLTYSPISYISWIKNRPLPLTCCHHHVCLSVSLALLSSHSHSHSFTLSKDWLFCSKGWYDFSSLEGIDSHNFVVIRF